MDELVRQGIALLLGLVGAGPLFYQIYRDRRTREKLQSMARRNLDGWGNALALLNRYLIIESDVDARIREETTKLEREYTDAWREYEGATKVEPKK